MAGSWHSSTFTTEFGHEFEAERATWLRKRFLWYTGVVGGFSALWTLAGGIALATHFESQWIAQFMLYLGSLLLFAAAFVHVWRRPMGKESLLKIAAGLIVVNGLIELVAVFITAMNQTGQPAGGGVGGVVLWSGLSQIFLTHFVACLFLPWTPRECYRPLIPLLVVFAGVELFEMRHTPVVAAVMIALSPLVGLPGALICWWRHSRFREQFTLRILRGRYAELKAELTSARTIHESLFPKPVVDGPVRFTYVYEPMRQIGGDYLYACFTPGAGGERALNVALIDVTGHGIPAALTVNRLHGELERIFAEHPDAGPGDVLTLLNRYVHLTLATHSVYVTALCFRADPTRGTLEYASGGHPPAFLRAVDGTIDQLDSTTFVLGACAGGDFRAEPRSLRFMPGDSLIAYTDGATEARNAAGKFLGVSGVQKLIAVSRQPTDANGLGWPAAILRAVEAHRQGPAADDTLVIEIARPVGTPGKGQFRTSPAFPAKVSVGTE